MVPARNLFRRHYDTYGGGGGFADFLQEEKIYVSTHHPSSSSSLMISSSPPMAAKEEKEQEQEQEQEQETSTSSSTKGAAADDRESWLQLRIGSSPTTAAVPSTALSNLDLDLFSNNKQPQPPLLPTTLHEPVQMFPRPWQYGFGQWGYWSSTPTTTLPLPSPSPSPRPLQPSTAQYYSNYFPQQYVVAALPTTSELRVISRPSTSRRQPAGVWFILQAAENQLGRSEPLLPQICKSYLRIKDGRMTVRLLMKYLVKKLGLDDESQVEISCRGQLLLPYLTLQHVRDNIWCLRETVAFLSDSTTDHVMTLQYSRSC